MRTYAPGPFHPSHRRPGADAARPGACALAPSAAAAMLRCRLNRTARSGRRCRAQSARCALLGCSASLAHSYRACSGHGVPCDSRRRWLARAIGRHRGGVGVVGAAACAGARRRGARRVLVLAGAPGPPASLPSPRASRAPLPRLVGACATPRAPTPRAPPAAVVGLRGTRSSAACSSPLRMARPSRRCVPRAAALPAQRKCGGHSASARRSAMAAESPSSASRGASVGRISAV
jgi:hypothetical protein